MREFFYIFLGLFQDLISMIDRVKFTFGLWTVSLLDVAVPCIFVSMLIGLLWKGAKG